MTELETYLNTATRGLWGKKKLEVREELENHVLEQARKLELQGFDQTDAIQKVLEQIGPANIVSRGMIGVHTMPNVFRSTLLIVSLCIGVLATIPSSIAQVATFSGIMSQRNNSDFVWLNLTSLNDTLKQAGVKIANEKKGYRLTFPEGSRAFVQATSTRKGQPYISTAELIDALEQTKLNIVLSGYNNPSIGIGKTQITLGTKTKPVQGNLFYSSFLLRIALTQTPEISKIIDYAYPVIACCSESENTVMTLDSTEHHQIAATVKPNQVFGILLSTQNPMRPSQKFIELGLAHSDNTGQLELITKETKLEFVDQIEKIFEKPSRSGFIKAVLIELTGPYRQFGGSKPSDLRILVPETKYSEAIK
jgi:hypothetical protein